MSRTYKRDKRSPIPKSETVSRVMSANKGKNTKPEITLRKALWKRGLRGYRIHSKKLPGKPDIVFNRKKLAIFVHGCFWHRCPYCSNYGTPRTNSDYWERKFRKNVERDRRHERLLTEMNWKIIVVWECQLIGQPHTIADVISATLSQST